MLCWHLITKDRDYAFARPGLNAHNGPIGRHAMGVRALMRRSPKARGPVPVNSSCTPRANGS